MQYWLWSATQENWEILLRKKAWATYNRNVAVKIRKGDIFIFYVKGTLHFKGIFRTVSDWYETQELVWSDEISEHKKKYPNQISLEIVQLGEVNYKDFVPRLNFVEKKHAPQVYIQGSGGWPVNFKKPITDSDYEAILMEMKKTPTQAPLLATSRAEAPPSAPSRTVPEKKHLSHSEMATMLVELAEMFGKSAEREYLVGPYRYDVVWKRVKVGNPTKVFEVHDKGSLGFRTC